MNQKLVLRSAAKAEYNRAGDWYEAQRSGLALVFTTAVQKVFDRIVLQPKTHNAVYRDIRKAVVKGFPFCVFYRERADTIVVISVFHTSRDPEIWKRRA